MSRTAASLTPGDPRHARRRRHGLELHGRLLRLEILPEAVAPQLHTLPRGRVGGCLIVHKACTHTYGSCNCNNISLALQAAGLDGRSFLLGCGCYCWLDIPYRVVSQGSLNVSAVA